MSALKITVLTCLTLSCALAVDYPVVHPVFADHCVLQRQRPIPVWGWAAAGAKVTVNLDQVSVQGTADANGRWQVELPAREAGGPYEVTISGASDCGNRVLHDVMIGDVWICSGQSNMQQGIGAARDAEQEIANANYPNLRLSFLSRATSAVPEPLAKITWAVTTPSNVRKLGDWNGFSAVAYYFGRDLQRELNIPIGVIQTCWGGTPAQAWISAEGLAPLNDFNSQIEHLAVLRRNGGTDPDFAKRSEAWWAERDPGTANQYFTNTLATDDWATISAPGTWEQQSLGDIDGIVWLRKTVAIPADWQGKPLQLSFGAIDDDDVTWVGGIRVGEKSGWNQRRLYAIPADTLTAGPQTIAIRVIDFGGGGGIHGQPNDTWIGIADDPAQRISLIGEWQAKATITDPKIVRSAPKPANENPNFSTILSNAMIEPLVPLSVTGVIWYQGEANAGNAGQYRNLLPALFADWRLRFHNPTMHFGVVQLASFMDRSTDPIQEGWASIRESQALVVAADPHASLAVAIDIGDATDIHPKNKQDVGKRLAQGILTTHYRRDGVGSGPAFSGLLIDGPAVTVQFTHNTGLHTTDKEAPKGFAIADPNGVWHHAQAEIRDQTIILHAPEVQEPRAVRYAWGNNPAVNVVNDADLPMVPFRSDGP